MKKCIIFSFVLIASMIFVFADTQLGRTKDTFTDNSFVIQAYYKGTSANTNMDIALSFKDSGNQSINHDDQGGTTGTKVNVSNSHIGANTGTIFTWEMSGKNGKQKSVQLKFVFSTLQAELNGHYYRPTYTLTMTQNRTKYNNTNLTDSFYNASSLVVGGGQTTGTKDDSSDEYTHSDSITYSGIISGNGYYNTYTWKRSGTCTLNIADYYNTIPGSYHYVCWVIAEFSVQ